MTGENFWDIFADTGEPMGWLLYRAAGSAGKDKEKRGGETEHPPSPSD